MERERERGRKESRNNRICLQTELSTELYEAKISF